MEVIYLKFPSEEAKKKKQHIASDFALPIILVYNSYDSEAPMFIFCAFHALFFSVTKI